MASTPLAPAPPLKVFREVEVPRQRDFDGVRFPLALAPQSPAATNLAAAVKEHKPWLEDRLKEAGAILFRGFALPTASEFNDVVESFGYEDVGFLAGAAPRTHVVGRIYTSNDGPPHLNLQFHNEMAYMEDHPSKALFYCEVEPAREGETPIVLGHRVYARLKKKHWEFLRRLEEHGLIYNKVLADETDPSSPIGRSWKSTFSTDRKSVAEQKAAEMGWKLKWLESGVRVIMGPVPGIKIGPEKPKVWFNSLIAAQTTYVDARNEAGKAVTFGDETPIPPEVIDDCKSILEEECAAIPWKQGDVLFLDNLAVPHSRRPFSPPRRVLAAFCR